MNNDEYPDLWPVIADRRKIEENWRCERCRHPDPPIEIYPAVWAVKGHRLEGTPCRVRDVRETKDYRAAAKHEIEFVDCEVIERVTGELQRREHRGHSCDQKCTHPDDGKQRILTVHHLDGRESNCRRWNLAVLCQVCHLHIQGKVVFRQRFMYEHSDWMKKHVEGYRQFRKSEIQGKWNE